MHRKIKIGIVGILLLSIMIPVAVSVSSNSATIPSPQQIQQANDIAIKAVADASKNTVAIANSANPLYGYSNGLYLWISPGINDIYNWGSTTYIPLKVEVWDGNGNNLNGATVYEYLSWWDNSCSCWRSQYTRNYNTGRTGDDVRILWQLSPGRYWYSFIEGYYYDINNGFHYVYQQKYFNT